MVEGPTEETKEVIRNLHMQLKIRDLLTIFSKCLFYRYFRCFFKTKNNYEILVYLYNVFAVREGLLITSV